MNRLRTGAIAIGVAGALALSSTIDFKCRQPSGESINKRPSVSVFDGGEVRNRLSETLRKSTKTTERSFLTVEDKEFLDLYCEVMSNFPKYQKTTKKL